MVDIAFSEIGSMNFVAVVMFRLFVGIAGRKRTLYGDLVVTLCALVFGEPFMDIVCVAVAPCEFVLNSTKLYGDRACRSALAVAPCEFVLSSANPLWRLYVSKFFRYGAVRICLELIEPSADRACAVRICLEFDEPSMEIVCVEALCALRNSS